MKKFPVDISESGIRALLNSPDSYARRFTETSLRALLNYSEIQGTLSNQKNEFPPVPWEMEKLRAKVKSEVSKHVFGWYGETESAAGYWHSHHNESGEDAHVLPIQDAGLHT